MIAIDDGDPLAPFPGCGLQYVPDSKRPRLGVRLARDLFALGEVINVGPPEYPLA